MQWRIFSSPTAYSPRDFELPPSSLTSTHAALVRDIMMGGDRIYGEYGGRKIRKSTALVQETDLQMAIIQSITG